MEMEKTRRAAWTPPARPDWVAHVNAEGNRLDLKSVVPLDAESLITAATRNTGLTDFGSEDWREPFELICRALDEEAHLNLMGRLMTRTDMLMLLEGRLRVENEYRLHPEIEDERIEAPILVVGQGRTGTSAMINLLAEDPGNAVVRTWQAMFPCPPKSAAERAETIRVADERVTMWTRVTPELEFVHEWTAEVPTESIHVECLSFQMPSWQNIYGQSPSHTAYMAVRSKINAVSYEKRVLKLLQWRQPRRQWVLKSPDALNYLPDVLAVYPDVRLVWMHRDPIVALSSAVNLVGILAWARSDKVLSEGTFGAVADPALAAGMLTRPIDWIAEGLVPKTHLLNIYYKDFVNDPLASVAEIYAFCGVTMTGEGEAHMQSYARLRPREARPPHRYDSGTTERISQERVAFRRYQEYFGVADEV